MTVTQTRAVDGVTPGDGEPATSEDRAREIRRLVLEMCRGRGQGYAGQGCELADVMAVLFHDRLRRDGDDLHDRFVLSTGHSAIALYAALGTVGTYTEEQLRTYGEDGSEVEESPLEEAPGFEVTGGSLGLGPSQAVGMALGERMRGSGRRVVCQLGDGELQEGAVWEAFLLAGARGLGDLTFFVDRNGEQADGATADVLDVEPLLDKLHAFGLDAEVVDGHDHDALRRAFDAALASRRPTCLVLDTVPGKGVPTLETHVKVHYVRVDDDVWAQALAEVTG